MGNHARMLYLYGLLVTICFSYNYCYSNISVFVFVQKESVDEAKQLTRIVKALNFDYYWQDFVIALLLQLKVISDVFREIKCEIDCCTMAVYGISQNGQSASHL